MNIKSISAELINPAPYNPRLDLKPGDVEYEKIKRSIQEFGYVEPLVWNENTGHLVGGHQRFKILMESEPEKITVSVVNLDTKQERLLNIALNKIDGQWDEGKLTELLKQLNEEDYDLNLTGFEFDELVELEIIDDVIDDLEQATDDEFDFDKTVNKLKENASETKIGDLWQLGPHFLYCGDSTNINHVKALLNGKKANLIVTDPPYNVAVESDSVKLIKDGKESIMNDKMKDEDFEDFLSKIFHSYASIMEDNAAIYVFHPCSYQSHFEKAMRLNKLDIRTQCIWVKNAASFGWSQYRFKHEPVFYGHKIKQSPAWYGNRKQTTVWRAGIEAEEKLPETVWEVSRGDISKYVHPTQKPLDLLNIPIKNSSKREDLIVDLFGGSGSTLLAADQLKRNCALMELDPYFCDAIKKRYFDFTGIKPILISEQK